MKETTPAAMPPCFDRWCQRFDDIFGHQAQKREFRNYLGGLLGESERKNIQQMAANAVIRFASFMLAIALIVVGAWVHLDGAFGLLAAWCGLDAIAFNAVVCHIN